jgi:hypothetical protein
MTRETEDSRETEFWPEPGQKKPNRLFSHRACPWQVQRAADYRIFTAETVPEEGPKLTLLLQVDGGGHAGEGFRFAVDGGPWDAVIWTRDLLIPRIWAGTSYVTK